MIVIVIVERVKGFKGMNYEDFDAFHHKCGKNVVFSIERRLIATRRSGFGGLVFSAKPMPVDTMFQVKLLETEHGWKGFLVSTYSE